MGVGQLLVFCKKIQVLKACVEGWRKLSTNKSNHKEPEYVKAQEPSTTLDIQRMSWSLVVNKQKKINLR